MERHNELVLGLHQAATQCDPAQFQRVALSLLDQAIGFDRAWWGIMANRSGAPLLRSSYRLELPESFETQWEGMKHQDTLARDVRLQPRTTVNFDERSLRGTPGLAALNEAHDLRQALCTSAFLPDGTSFAFVSLFRSARARAFSEHEVRLKQIMTPHLYASWRTNLLFAVARRERDAPSHAVGFVDRSGRIVCADASFTAMVAEGWPGSPSSRVPAILIDGRPDGRGAHRPFRAQRRQVGGLTLIELHRLSPLETLTPREREIALEYAGSRSYKEIAQRIGISPTTVRHHLRVIFEKLEIGGKAQLVRIVEHALPWSPSRGIGPVVDALGGGPH